MLDAIKNFVFMATGFILLLVFVAVAMFVTTAVVLMGLTFLDWLYTQLTA